MELHFATIEHFCKVNYNCSDSTGTTSKWVASVVFYDVHQCRVWYGGPTEVWCRSLSAAGSLYIDLSGIQSRVAYCEADVDFGRVIGIMIVSSLTNNYYNACKHYTTV